MLYDWYELSHAAARPWRALASVQRMAITNPLNPFRDAPPARQIAAACEMFERATRRYSKPEFAITETVIDGRQVPVREVVVWRRPFCRLLAFQTDLPAKEGKRRPNLLIVAPMSGHFASLLRGTVEALLPTFDVYITDWSDARDVPLVAGAFDLDEYIAYIIDMLVLFGGDVHVYAVSQPAVPVLAAIAVLEGAGSLAAPRSMVLVGGPIDARINPTRVNEISKERGVDWFLRNAITTVPWPNAGVGRQVYPGFMQLSGVMGMSPALHVEAHHAYFDLLVRGDGQSAEMHRAFYDDYLAVMDLTAEFYLQTLETVLIRHDLPRGKLRYHDGIVDLSAISHAALMTVEGGKDEIAGAGQCSAAHALCTRIPLARRSAFTCPQVGHYGLFNGSWFRRDIAPRIAAFIFAHDPRDGVFQESPIDAASEHAADKVASVAFTFGNN